MVQRQSVDFIDFYNDYINDIKRKLQRSLNKAVRDTYAEFFALVEQKIQTMFNSVVQDFYASYSPKLYDRNDSLYDLLQTTLTANSLSISFDPEKMTPFRSGYSGEDGLYDQVFRHGWHGGADRGDGHPSNGTPYWRTPPPYYSRWGHEADMSTISPLDDFKRRLDDYKQNGYRSDFNRIWSVHKSRMTIDE